MSEQKKQPDNKPSSQKDISWAVKAGILLFLVVISLWILDIYPLNYVLSIFNWSAYVGFFLSCLGMFYISYKVFIEISITGGNIKYFTKCELPSRLNLVFLLFFSVMIVTFISFKTKNWLSYDVADSVMLVALMLSIVFILILFNQTRTSTILLVLFAIYFFNSLFFSEQKNNSYLILVMGGILLTTIGLGVFSLSFQKPKHEAFFDWAEELQEKRRETKEILHLLSETPDAKELSSITQVPLEELENSQKSLGSTIRRAVWDLEYEAHKGFEKKANSEMQEFKKNFTSTVVAELNKIKQQNLPSNFKDDRNHILSAIEQSEQHLDNIKQQIQHIERAKPYLEKVKTLLGKTIPRPSSALININGALDHIDLFQKNITPTLKEAIEVFEKIKPYIKQQEFNHHAINQEIQDMLKKLHIKANDVEK